MKTLTSLVAAALLLTAGGLAQSHGNHDHEEAAPFTQREAGGRAMSIVRSLVESKKLATSWKGKQPKEVVSKATPMGVLWVVTFHNPAEKTPAKQTLYVFLDDMGNYRGANHSGKY